MRHPRATPGIAFMRNREVVVPRAVQYRAAMRLEKIKLAGFKSFVDPTTVPFPSNLAGIVGPNGCGKSNVIDAVRWVMGESSAKMLRGQSMADVIFNGSTSRKPVGQAGIELIFDNSDGGAGGEYARFNQISVKRQISRDGQSVYLLNGSRCRRRDIQDLFLGTGLGPRSYSIIEQGMISRFIEARPEELRLFLEEAAGISKYKERRRETENRIRHTRDNLARLDDLREEVAKQLQHLERQAATAEKYRTLKADERRLSAELTALRWRDLDQEIETRDRALAEAENRVEAERATQRRLEAEIEEHRDAYSEASEQFNAVQGRYYAVGSEITRLEQAIQFATENRNRQEAELGRVRREHEDAAALLQRDHERLAELDAALAADLPRLEEARERQDSAAEALAAAEDALDAWQAQWDAVQREAAAPTEQAQTERGRINALEQRMAQDDQRAARVDEEFGRLDTAELGERIERLGERSEGLDERIAAAADAQTRTTEQLRDLDEQRRALGARLDAARTELSTSRGRQASLEALQDAALEAGGDAVAAWIEARGLQDAERLLDLIDVDPGWQAAVESALGEALSAVCIDPDAFDAHGAAADCEGLTLLAAGDAAEPAAGLLAHVRCPWPLDALLAGFETAEDLPEALTRRAALGAERRIVCRDGRIIGRDWLRTPAGSEGLAGSLARADALKTLQAAIDELEGVIDTLADEHDAMAEQRTTLETERDQALDQVGRLSRERATLDAELGAARSRRKHLEERREGLTAEREELAERRDEATDEIETARERLHQALEAVDALAGKREGLERERERLRAAVAEARAGAGAGADEARRLELAVETRRASRDGITAALERAEDQLASLQERRDALLDALEETTEPVAEQRERLEEQLGLRLDVESALTEARDAMERLDAAVRAKEQQRQRTEQRVAEAVRGLDGQRMERQERLIRRQTQEEQLKADGQRPETVLADVAADADAETCAKALERVGNRIARLGNINLAAIDEFEEQSERMRYLDEQHGDISRSLETLETAIRKIDRETRARFKETFDRVNAGVQQLFPRMFGGGSAYLELTGDDLLETGVTIMARPPGKRNSSIHLLSGGEKALTAVSLVFAIFQLNPAPFCMLDEVDAPLDDANVGRFCELVRSMSEQIQFIFITHNKVTMEIADHLIGVTMHEPGCSRLVAVDVDEAARLAAAS